MTGSAIVVGGGLSGLAAAFKLQQAGQEVTVLERADRVGGCAHTERVGDYLVDTGCDLINGSFEHYLALAREVGISDSIVRSSGVVDVLRDGKVFSVNRGKPMSLVRNPVLSYRAKCAFAAGAVRLLPKVRRLDPYALTDHTSADHGTAHELCVRYFNKEVTDHIVDPVMRVFAGSGTKHASGLSVLAALAVGTKPMFALRGGMCTVPQALAQRLDLRVGAEVTSIEDSENPEGGVTVGYRVDGHSAEASAQTCVLAIPYHEAERLWPPLERAGGQFGRALKDLPLLSVSLGYDAPSPTPAYAVLVPSVESAEILLLTFQQNKAPDRAPDGKTLVTVYSDALVTDRLMKLSDAELVAWASEFVERYYPSLRGRRDAQSVARWPHTGYWPSPGYWTGISEMRARLPKWNVHITSTLFGSGGIERAVLGGERTANRILSRGKAR